VSVADTNGAFPQLEAPSTSIAIAMTLGRSPQSSSCARIGVPTRMRH